ncbi:MAG: ribulose-phosphate 3-epimerase [Mycoplasmataceae bacterium]|jgi:ribulose-phosphate 3-epimerase|nr:ribulose-phosphate 3-epimerase [Mycoplasmataceae bacterium]
MKFLEPSLLAFDKEKIEDQLNDVKNAGAKYIHYDVMDGKFVPNKALGTEYIKLINKLDMKVCVHVMVYKVLKYFKEFSKFKIYSFSFHPEACKNIKQALKIMQIIKNAGILAGIVINPDTSCIAYEELIKAADMVTVMGVFPGKCGQKFIPNSIENLKFVKNIKDTYNKKIIITLDGGVRESIIKDTKKYVDHFVSGSFLTSAKNKQAIFDLVK